MMGDVDLRVAVNKDVLDAIFALEMRVARLESAVAKMVIRIDPTTSYAQALETLRS
jgi:prefoldin subunit 5